jgi:CheY-like chemotaxis protein
LRFLVIDADERFRAELSRLIERAWPDAVLVEHGACSDPALTAVASGGFDAVLLGHPQRGERGFAQLEALRRIALCPPVILFAAKSDEFLAVDALKAGAASFFPKTQLQARRLLDVISAETANARSARAAGRPLAERGRPSAAGRRLVEKIYSGELASVYLAVDDKSGEKYAFKVLRHVPDAGESRLFDRFLQEYEVIARLRHPNVVRIFDLGIADDHAYIAMEYLGAGSLATRLGKALRPQRAVDYARRIAGALSAIHAAGILHRDLKPGNVMFRDDGSLALIDFGLAKQLALEMAITGTGRIFGTPYYMSPEQGHAEPTDERSDLYSLGCMLFEMLTARRPFVASTPMGVIYKHAQAPRPTLPDALAPAAQVVARLLAVDPAQRFPTAATVAAALDEVRFDELGA